MTLFSHLCIERIYALYFAAISLFFCRYAGNPAHAPVNKQGLFLATSAHRNQRCVLTGPPFQATFIHSLLRANIEWIRMEVLEAISEAT